MPLTRICEGEERDASQHWVIEFPQLHDTAQSDDRVKKFQNMLSMGNCRTVFRLFVLYACLSIRKSYTTQNFGKKKGGRNPHAEGCERNLEKQKKRDHSKKLISDNFTHLMYSTFRKTKEEGPQQEVDQR